MARLLLAARSMSAVLRSMVVRAASRCSLGLAIATGACTPAQESARTTHVAADVSPPAAATPPGPISDLRAFARVPDRVAYDASAFGISAQFVSIRVDNVGGRLVPVKHLHASFAATRAGVSFACNRHVDAIDGAGEPTHLAPGQSFTFERLLDCSMPLPGPYEVNVWLHSSEHDGEGPGAPVDGVFVGSFQVDVSAAGNAPRRISLRDELYALMTGSPIAMPLPYDAWRGGSYKVAVALINGGARAVAIGQSTVAMSLLREGGTFACSAREQTLDEPRVLPAGSVHVVLVPVTCAPEELGRYEVVARFTGGDVREVDIGRFGLLVTGNPYFSFVPEWPMFPLAPDAHTP
jgi:hypothetical protein